MRWEDVDDVDEDDGGRMEVLGQNPKFRCCQRGDGSRVFSDTRSESNPCADKLGHKGPVKAEIGTFSERNRTKTK
jgi:hypothetical protein